MFSKVLVGGSALAMTLGVIPGIGMGKVEAAAIRPKGSMITIKSSELKEYVQNDCEIPYDEGVEKVVIDMDEELNVPGDIVASGSLSIEGDKKLTVGGMIIDGDLNIFEEANIVVNSGDMNDYSINIDGGLTTSGNLTIESCQYGIRTYDRYNDDDMDSTSNYYVHVAGGKLTIKDGSFGIDAANSVLIDGGEVDITNEEYGIRTYGSLKINGGKVTEKIEKSKGMDAEGEIIINAGEVNVEAEDSAIYAGEINISGGNVNLNVDRYDAIKTYDGDLNISGGNVIANADNDAISSGKGINVTGGYVEANCSYEKTKDGYAVYATSHTADECNFIIGDDMYISTPENGQIVVNSTYYNNYFYLADSEGNSPSKAVIEKKPVPVDPDDKKDEDKKDEDKKVDPSDKKEEKSDDKKDDSSDKKEDKSEDKKDDQKKADTKHSSEWVDGKWYNEDGTQTYKGTLSWKQNEKGWWVEDSDGWYPSNQWQKIDGKWYFFTADGYMDYSEYREGCWLGADGAWDESYSGGHWMQDAKGWWYEDASGWYPQSQFVWIDGVQYWFGADGYMA